MEQHPVYLGIGSNLGDRAGHIELALSQVAEIESTRVVVVSEIVETPPVGPSAQGRYLNAVAAITTGLPPRRLLEELQAIERMHGRDRREEVRWGPRTLDLDILVYADLVLEEPGLTIPHPRLHEREFVLGPFAEIAAELILPVLNQSVGELLAALKRAELGADT